jgi:hypothetical protein
MKFILAVFTYLMIMLVLGVGIWLAVPDPEKHRPSHPSLLIFWSITYLFLFIRYGCLRK